MAMRPKLPQRSRCITIALQVTQTCKRQVTKRNLKHVKDRTAPAGQFGDEDHVDLAGLRQRQDLLAFGALLLCPGGDFLPDPPRFCSRPSWRRRVGPVPGGHSVWSAVDTRQ